MGARRAKSVSAAVTALACGALVGCALVSGAADLTIGDVGGGGGGEAGGIDASGAVDGASPDAPPPDGALLDAPSDGPLDGGSRLKDITFENGSLIDPVTGADSVTGTPTLLTAVDSISGSFSMEVSTDVAYLTENFPNSPELYVSFLIAVDPGTSITPIIIARINAAAGGAGAIDLGMAGAGRSLAIAQGTSTVIAGGSLPNDDVVYRVGIHLKSGAPGASVVELFVAQAKDPFGASVVRVTTLSIGTLAAMKLGAVTGSGAKLIVDDLRIDRAAFAAP
jgi:hypothetical protein